MVSFSLVFSVFVVACSSIAKAAVIIAAGVLLVRRGALTPEVRTGMSKMAAGLLVPCLLASVKATTLLLTGDAMTQLPSWLKLLAAFNALYWAVCGALFPRVIDA